MLRIYSTGVFPIIFLLTTATAVKAQNNNDLNLLTDGLDSIRLELKIPAMAAALMQGNSILFEKAYGMADLENQIKASVNTSFRIASITKTFTSTLVMQLVQQGKLDLQTPISYYGLDLGNPKITVKNLLTHTSEGEVGSSYQYNGYRFGRLGPVIEKASGKPFYQLLMENIIMPLNMESTAPGLKPEKYLVYTTQYKDMLPFFETSYVHLAKAYALNEKGEIKEIKYLDEFGAFGGLVSTVGDLLKYSAAIDRNQFLPANIQKEIFTPNRTKKGTVTPYGLGWFVQTYQGTDYDWHYGQTDGESGLFVKVPSLKLTLAVLSNTDKLSQPFSLGDGDLFTSPVGQLLFKYYINKDSRFVTINYHLPVEFIRKKLIASKGSLYKDFYNKELVAQAAMSIVKGDTARALAFYELYADLNFTKTESPTGKEIVSLQNVGINQDLTRSFILEKPTQVRIYGVGENCSGDYSSWCDYGLIEDSTGKMIWQMQGQKAVHAGGTVRNQRVETVITLPAGTYKLRYKSDGGHAFNNWDSAPPEGFFWGIILFENADDK